MLSLQLIPFAQVEEMGGLLTEICKNEKIVFINVMLEFLFT